MFQSLIGIWFDFNLVGDTTEIEVKMFQSLIGIWFDFNLGVVLPPGPTERQNKDYNPKKLSPFSNTLPLAPHQAKNTAVSIGISPPIRSILP